MPIRSEYLRRRLAETQSAKAEYWYAYSHLNTEEEDKLKAIAGENGILKNEVSFQDTGFFAVEVLKKASDDLYKIACSKCSQKKSTH